MVYCGKASLGCQSCRQRRIKCDKIRPDCTQCVRVGKKCPGYRDQLSLMFRDESTKVMKKARAQWGPEEGEAGSSGSVTSTEVSRSTTSQRPRTATSVSSPTSVASGNALIPSTPNPSAKLGLTLDEQATQFYINRYVIGHPDEPRNADELAEIPWIWSPMLEDAMVAVGLAGLSNIRNDGELMTIARQRYGKALRQTGALISSKIAPSHEAMRLIVMLALFELVKGAFNHEGSVTTHVQGGTAMIRSWLPTPDTLLSTPKVTFSGLRALVQMAYTMFIPSFVAGNPVPSSLYDILDFSKGYSSVEDMPALDLAYLIGKFVNLAAYVKGHILSDGRPAATKMMQKLLGMDTELLAWARGLPENWKYSVRREKGLPQDAVFEGEWHVYHDMWVARIWAHYRWARILLQQMILFMMDSCPTSSLPLMSVSERAQRFDLIRQLSRDTLASTPIHWRHPSLSENRHIQVQQTGGAGSGAAGVPVLVFQLQTAACAPGVPISHWNWVSGILECIWGDMGMLHAKSMREAMIAHREKLQTMSAESILAPASVC